MEKDCNYDKAKLIHHIAKLNHFINKHAIEDAKAAGHPHCESMYREIAEQLEESLKKLKQAVTGLAKEDKFE